jgi:Zn-finger nucleic acid-binding protein
MASEAGANLVCPRCSQPLLIAKAGAAVLHGCRACGGLWLDGTTAQRLTQALDGHELSLADAASQHATHAADTRGLMLCPVCRAGLARWTVPNAGVEVDTCSAHGTWFDRHELQRIAQSASIARAYGRHAAPTGGTPMAAARASADSSPDSDSGLDALGIGLAVVVGVLDVFGD